MTTSTPPAWRFLHECDVPVQVYQHMTSETLSEHDRIGRLAELSVQARKVPVSATLREQNDSDTCHICLGRVSGTVFMHDGKAYHKGCYLGTREQSDSSDPTYRGCQPSERYLSDGPDPTGEDVWPLDRDQCDDCRAAPGRPHAPDCDVSSSPDISCDRKDDNLHDGEPLLRVAEPGEPLLRVESCPECGTVTDIEYMASVDRIGDAYGALLDRGVDMNEEPAVETHERVQGKDPDRIVDTLDTFSVPFQVQSWTFEALIELEVDHLHEIIDDHHDEIVEMARRRHREGFVAHGSGMYAWSPERRLDETLQELADAGVYPTSGPLERTGGKTHD